MPAGVPGALAQAAAAYDQFLPRVPEDAIGAPSDWASPGGIPFLSEHVTYCPAALALCLAVPAR